MAASSVAATAAAPAKAAPKFSPGTQTNTHGTGMPTAHHPRLLVHIGLAGIYAGETAISTVGEKGIGLTYRGYGILDLSANCIFEEVAYLLLHGSLPDARQLAAYKTKLAPYRVLPEALRVALERIPATAHPMNVMEAGAALMGCLRPEGKDNTQDDVFDGLIAAFGSILLYWYHYSTRGVRIETAGKPSDTIASHFVRLLQNNGTEVQ